MYEFLPVSERMQEMREAVRDRVIIHDSLVSRIATEADKKCGPMLPYLKHAKIIKAILTEMVPRVEDFEMLVCNKGVEFCGTSLPPFWGVDATVLAGVGSGRWTLREDGYYHNPDDSECRMACKKEDYEEFLEHAKYWADKTPDAIIKQSVPEGYSEICRVGGSPCGDKMPIMMMPAGHLTPGYNNLMKIGIGNVRKQAQDWLDSHRNDLMGDDTDKWMFYTAMIDYCDGMIAYINNYAEACEAKAAETTDEARKAELLSMADGLRWISTRTPRHFREACQLYLLYMQSVLHEGLNDIGSCGRFDQNVWPFLKSDLETGYITMEEAQEIVDCFFLKVNGFYRGNEGPLAQIIGIGNTYMHTTVGGVDPDTGEDASNPVTYMTLAALGRMKLHDPTISLRINKDTPDDLWDVAIRVNAMVGGLPLFQNDEVIIPALMRELGFSLRDARDYAIIGCQEITGQGTDYACCNGVIPPNTNLHYPALLTMAINNGINPTTKEQSSIHTGYLYDMTNIEQVKAAWSEIAEYTLRGVMSMNNLCEYIVQHYTPYLSLSAFMDDCMARGMDCTWGGCRYNEYGGTATGLATVADSLTAIDYMCFQKKICTTRELYDAVMANWEGYEELQAKIIKEVPHFGNGDEYADSMMDWVTNEYYEMSNRIFSKRAKKFRSGLYGASDHVAQGYVTWATPDGRKFGEPIADGASPCQGRDTNGPTAVLRSANCYDHSKFMDGLALNIRLHPSTVSNQEGIDKLRDLTKAYLDEGGMEVQYNVVSTEDMRAAQENPEAYRNMVVRIAGYSAYFVELSKDQQDDLISRTENSF